MLSKMTQGAFDISYGSIDKRFGILIKKKKKKKKNMKELPNEETAKKTVELINYKNIILNPNDTSVFLKEKGMRIGFGGIGKGICR